MLPLSMQFRVVNSAAVRARIVLHPPRVDAHRLFATMSENPPQPYLSHEERTADQPRDEDTHKVVVSQIGIINNSIRVLRLSPMAMKRQVKFSPGQWLDVHVPGLSKAGGFTITSTPADADPNPANEGSILHKSTEPEEVYEELIQHQHIDPSYRPFLELAVNYAPRNPPAAWLWGSSSLVMGAELMVRVGGNFIWPPPNISNPSSIERLVLVAGGVGINPLMSIISHLHHTNSLPRNTVLLYSTKIPATNSHISISPSRVLFLPRIMSIAATSPTIEINVFLTGEGASNMHIPESTNINRYHRRISQDDLTRAIGQDIQKRKKSVAYVCGPQKLTDDTVAFLESLENMRGRVLCERWW